MYDLEYESCAIKRRLPVQAGTASEMFAGKHAPSRLPRETTNDIRGRRVGLTRLYARRGTSPDFHSHKQCRTEPQSEFSSISCSFNSDHACLQEVLTSFAPAPCEQWHPLQLHSRTANQVPELHPDCQPRRNCSVRNLCVEGKSASNNFSQTSRPDSIRIWRPNNDSLHRPRCPIATRSELTIRCQPR